MSLLAQAKRQLTECATAIRSIVGLSQPSLADLVCSERQRHFKNNQQLRVHRRSALARAVGWAIRHPALTFGVVVALYSVTLMVTWWSPLGGPKVPDGIETDYFRDFAEINLGLLGAQSAFVGLVFPLVIAFVSLINQGLASFGARLSIFFEETAARFVGISALALCAVIVFQLPLAGLIPVRLVAALTALNIVWFTANVLALGFFLLKTLEFVHPASRMLVIRRYVANSCWPAELSGLLLGNRWLDASNYADLPTKAGRAHVRYMSFLETASPIVTRHFQTPHTLCDVKIGSLRAATSAWLRSEETRGDAAGSLALTISPGETYEGRAVLARSKSPVGWGSPRGNKYGMPI